MEVICDKREVSEARAGYVYSCTFVKPEKNGAKLEGPGLFYVAVLMLQGSVLID